MSFTLAPDRETTTKLFRAKMEYGQLFLFKYNNVTFVFRPLTIKELDTIVKLSSYLDDVCIEDWIVEHTFIGKDAVKQFVLEKTPYQYVKYLAAKIALLSTVQSEEEYKEKLNEERSKINTLQNVVEVLIRKGYSSYSHEDIKEMTQIKQFEILAKAENICQEKLDLGEKKQSRAMLRKFTEGATVIGAEDITSPEVADKPEF